MIKIDKRKLKRKLIPSQIFFLSLAGSIIYQQISTKAGDSIYKKFLKLFGRRKPTPELFLELSEKILRSAGLSNQKFSYLKDLAKKFLDNTIDPRLFYKMSDKEVRGHLVQVKGIGPWTSDMFLIFALNRPNILPVGDLGIAKGFQKVFNLKVLPNERKMRNLAKPYCGEYSYLALYLWQSNDE
ncbi:MAG: DNA-3-methyladenine glycosylase 2 family protein [Patescibacteria group bacterium]